MKTAPILILAVTLVASGCASQGGGKLPVCDGKHLRPANPHGSVLDPTAPAAPAGATAEPAGSDHPGCGQ